MKDIIVYQVRSVDSYGNQHVVHAYETEDDAKNAIIMMRSKTGKRYVYYPVPNQPNEYWGVNFPSVS